MLRMHKLICEIEKGKLTKNKCAKNTYQMIIQSFQIKGRMHITNMIGTYSLLNVGRPRNFQTSAKLRI